jgi:hypothetical protein
MSELDALIDQFGELKENWDGYGASELVQKVCDNAHSLVAVLSKLSIPEPELSLTSNGTIMFEWEWAGTGNCICVEVGTTKWNGYIKTAKSVVYFEAWEK